MSAGVELLSVRKVFGDDAVGVVALDDVSLTVAPGSFTAVMGPSGSGKSTLLHITAGLESVTTGDVLVGGVSLVGRSEAGRARLRRSRIGVVFQQYNLLPSLTAVQNVTLPLRLDGRPVDAPTCAALLERLGLADRAHHRPAELSGGQQQRVAIARALLMRPSVILADEPTGSLDSGYKHALLTLLRESVRDLDQTIVMVTHDPVDASYADDVVLLSDGRVAGSMAAPGVDAIADRIAHLGTPPSPGGGPRVDGRD